MAKPQKQPFWCARVRVHPPDSAPVHVGTTETLVEPIYAKDEADARNKAVETVAESFPHAGGWQIIHISEITGEGRVKNPAVHAGPPNPIRINPARKAVQYDLLPAREQTDVAKPRVSAPAATVTPSLYNPDPFTEELLGKIKQGG